MTELSTTVLQSVAEEIEAAAVTTITTVREYQIRYFWEIGKILKASDAPITELIQGLARDHRLQRIHMGERSLWDAYRIYGAYNEFEAIYATEHGQNISITKLRALMSPTEKKLEKGDEEIATALIKKYGFDRAKAIARAVLEYKSPE